MEARAIATAYYDARLHSKLKFAGAVACASIIFVAKHHTKVSNLMETIFKREVHSFVRRQRRLTKRLEKAMTMAWPQFGVSVSDNAILDLNAIFGRENDKILEIGFGHGDTLLPMAIQHPDYDYLGIEVHEPGIAAVMMGIIENDLNNIRVIQHDAVKIVERHLADNTLSRVHLYFPDPWPKKRHHKRRIVQPDFIALLMRKLQHHGVLHFATDWQPYAEHMMDVLSKESKLKNVYGDRQFANNDELHLRSNTKFELRGRKLGHEVFDLVFVNE